MAESSTHSLPRYNHPLQPRLPIIAARAVIKDGDTETTPTIAMRAPQSELQIVDEKIRRHPMVVL
jgi:hypothetical protein